MSLRSSGTGWRTLGALGLVWLTSADAEPPATVTPSALQACASLTADAERLACYDRLAGRKPATAATPAPSSHAPEATAAAGATSAPSSHAAAATPAPAAPPASTSFGQYAAEHPRPAVANSLEAPVAAVGTGANGHTTISLAGGAVWELDDPDPLLRAGDVVTITRAAFGSYIMHTPTRRTHRVRRLN